MKENEEVQPEPLLMFMGSVNDRNNNEVRENYVICRYMYKDW
jgi:hypothetical protein